MTVQEYFGDWIKVIDVSEADRIIKKILSIKHIICPKVKDIFRAFTLCSLNNLKVVIIGKDPYSTIENWIPTATGIAFGNSKDTLESNYSPSLEVLMNSVIDFTMPHSNIIFDPSLEKWESQGVLLLNSALSCLANRAGSHILMWRPFIEKFLSRLSKHNTGIVYVLMGTEAQSFEPWINSRFNYIIKTKHPSWYARNNVSMPSDIWKEINKILTSLYGSGIEWYNEYKL